MPGAVALQEAMRVRPVAATGSTRYTKRALVLGGHFLPKGTMVDVPFYAVGPAHCILARVALPAVLRGVSMLCTGMRGFFRSMDSVAHGTLMHRLR